MRRLAEMSQDELVRLLEAVPPGRCRTLTVTYPEPCRPRAGRLGFERTAGRGVTVLADRVTEPTGMHPGLDELLRTGSRTFRDSTEAAAFLRRAAAVALAVDPEAPNSIDETVRAIGVLVEPEDLAGILRRAVVGQDAALTTVAHAVAVHASRPRPAQPVSVLLTGPTGVGKTTIAEQLGPALTELTGLDVTTVKLHGGELTSDITATTVLGAPPGYVGHQHGAALPEALAAGPTCLVVDEAEKAAPFLFRLLLGLLDRGEVTLARPTDDGRRLLRAPETVVVLTSNLDLGRADRDAVLRSRLRAAGFAPELVGRLTAVAQLRPLDAVHRRLAARAAVDEVAATFDVRVREVDEHLLARAVEEADTHGGVRVLRHVVDRLLSLPLARAVHAVTSPVAVSLSTGGDRVVVIAHDAEEAPDA